MVNKPYFFSKTLTLIFLILLINFGVIFYKFGRSNNITGMSIKDTIIVTYSETSFNAKIFLISEWIFLGLGLFLAFMSDKGAFINAQKELQDININTLSQGSKTNLDTLYKLLKIKKQLRISAISRIFNVEKDIAIEWGKILQSGNLVKIGYPSIGEPIIKINEEKGELEKEGE